MSMSSISSKAPSACFSSVSILLCDRPRFPSSSHRLNLTSIVVPRLPGKLFLHFFLRQRRTELIYAPVELKIKLNAVFQVVLVKNFYSLEFVIIFKSVLHPNIPNPENYHQRDKKLNPIKWRWIFWVLRVAPM